MSGADIAIGAIEADHRDCFQSLPAHVAVLDSAGAIRLVNPAWQAFAQDNGGPREAYLGKNYLDVCRSWAECDVGGEAALEGVAAVLRGDQPDFSMEYPCHSPWEQRWFRMEVIPIDPRRPSGCIVSHIDITQVALQHMTVQEIAAGVRSCLDATGRDTGRAPPPSAVRPPSDEMATLLGEAVAEAHYLAARLLDFAKRDDFSAKEQTLFAAAMINQWATAIGDDMFGGKNFFDGKGA